MYNFSPFFLAKVSLCELVHSFATTICELHLPLLLCCRLFGTKCDKCSQCFSKNDYVMRAKTKIYHVECFRCCACMRRLETGDEFALRQDGLFCRHDHDVLEGGKHCTGAASIPGSENNNNASLTNNNHHLHPNDGSMSGKNRDRRGFNFLFFFFASFLSFFFSRATSSTPFESRRFWRSLKNCTLSRFIRKAKKKTEEDSRVPHLHAALSLKSISSLGTSITPSIVRNTVIEIRRLNYPRGRAKWEIRLLTCVMRRDMGYICGLSGTVYPHAPKDQIYKRAARSGGKLSSKDSPMLC